MSQQQEMELTTTSKNDNITDIEMDPKERYGFEYDIDAWYNLFKDFTATTEFIPLTIDEAKIICKQYEYSILNKKENELNSLDYEILDNLRNKIDNQMKSENIYFIRMSTRSPKDAAYQSEKMKEVLQRKLNERNYVTTKQEYLSNEEIQNNEFISFFESQIESLCVESGNEILELLTTSTRVYEDLIIALQYRNNNEWNIQIVLRNYILNHDIALEFRGFVYNKKLTALSQYYDALYYEKLNKNKQVYQHAIQSFFDNFIKEKLPWNNCILDFILIEDNNDNNNTQQENNLNLKVEILEFNPFNRFTGPALFSWSKDIEILKGNEPFEFRLRTEPLPVLRNENLKRKKEEDEEDNRNLEVMLQISCLDENLLSEHSNLINLVEEFMDDDLQRINSNLRYVLQKTTKESFMDYLKEKQEFSKEV
ncbi:hypothetical protein ABK040_013147 [Willaertia magna]